jgi:DNA invertase Pin-like site-specific DNA recombinase
MCKDYFAMRVSTQRTREKINKEQEVEKEFQQNFIRQKYIFQCAGYELTDENTFADRITGGSKAEDRPEFSRLLSIIQEGDTINFCTVDRFSRDYKNGMEMIDTLLYDYKVNIRFVADNKVLYAGKRFDASEWFYISMLLLTAEYQKRCIGQMTSQKLQAMKEQGAVLGRPTKELEDEQLAEIRNLHNGGFDITNISRRTGIGRRIVERVVKGE